MSARGGFGAARQPHAAVGGGGASAAARAPSSHQLCPAAARRPARAARTAGKRRYGAPPMLVIGGLGGPMRGWRWGFHPPPRHPPGSTPVSTNSCGVPSAAALRHGAPHAIGSVCSAHRSGVLAAPGCGAAADGYAARRPVTQRTAPTTPAPTCTTATPSCALLCRCRFTSPARHWVSLRLTLPAPRPPSLPTPRMQYTLQWFKFSDRWRRLAWRLQQPTYATWVGSTVITLALMRSVVSSAGPGDTRECGSGGAALAACVQLARCIAGLGATRAACVAGWVG